MPPGNSHMFVREIKAENFSVRSSRNKAVVPASRSSRREADVRLEDAASVAESPQLSYPAPSPRPLSIRNSLDLPNVHFFMGGILFSMA